MSDPRFISLLTTDYLRMISASEDYSKSELAQPVAKIHDGVSHLNLIMNAKTLFEQIEPQLDSSDFYLLMVDGQQGSGKSTVARELVHHAHLKNYEPLYSSGFDITMAPDKFVQQVVGHDKVCVILDDLSYILSATSAKAQSKIKSFFALIRHFLTQANNGNPVKVMVIVIAHFTTAVPPIFKNSNVWLFSKPTTLEYDHMVKIVGKTQKSREDLDKKFQTIMNIQAQTSKQKDLVLTISGERYAFKWGDKTDPGSGRLMLMIVNGKPVIYNSTNTWCEKCKHIGFGVKINTQDYNTNRPSEEEEKASKERGTQ